MTPFFAPATSRHAAHAGPPLPPLPFAGFAAAISAVLIIALLSFQSLKSREDNANQVTYSINVSTQLQAILLSLQDAETGQRGFLLTDEEAYLAPFSRAEVSINGAFQNARNLITDDRRLQQLDAVEKLSAAKMQELADTIELQKTGKSQAALAVVRSDRGKVLMDGIRAGIAEMQAEERNSLAAGQARWQAAVSYSVWIALGGSVVLLLLMVGAAITTSRDYRARQVQNWLRAGQMELSANLQGEQRLEKLGEKILQFLARYLDAQVGAVYLAEQNHFRRVAGYAIEPVMQDVVLRSRDGLLGQAVSENRSLHVRQVPEEFLKVSSGMGVSKPSELLIMPASIDGVVYAVVELGFFRSVGAPDRQLLERVAEPLGVAVRSAIDRTRLEDLLQETQRQAEELQSQQEELRVSNEELEQQSQIQRDSQARLETQQIELEQTNVQLEEHSQMLARQNDDLDMARTELLTKASELERSNQFKSEFLANMSHELRTPLNSSLILAKLLGDNSSGNLTDEQVKFARNIYSAGNDLLELINDILDLSKIEARKVIVSREAVSVPQLANNLLQTFQPIADEKGIVLKIAIDANAPAAMQSDSQRIRQILKNLLSNAVKFTLHGQVSVRIFTPATPDWIAFEVQDTGIGIAPEQHEVIFEPFRQADGTTNRKFGGTGLGLSISRHLAAMLGGRIDLESLPGAGSTFTLQLPLTAPETQEQSSNASPAFELPMQTRTPQSNNAITEQSFRPSDTRVRGAGPTGRVLLVIEDDETFAQTLCELATGLQYECLIASTADEGIAMALEHRPMAIVLDVRLPDHSGLSVLDRLKHDPITRHIPVQIISGFDYSQPAREMGASGVLIKPVDREQLVAALEELNRKASNHERAILIVEDNQIQRDSIRKLLESESVRVVAVASAAEALEQLRATTFDCMVLDLTLADASGHELLERMASDDRYSFPPVIVYTGRSLSPAEEQQLRRYSKSIIIKGAKSPERLLDEVSLFLHRVETSLSPEYQRLLRVARSREAVFDGRRLLLVEDDVRNVFAITRVLEPHGARLEIARNGREALQALEKHPDIELVLMDIMMPEMDGMEAMRKIRKQSALAKLPVIALTAKAMPDDRQRCLEAGANDYITKPIDIDKLLSLLRIWLPPRRNVSS